MLSRNRWHLFAALALLLHSACCAAGTLTLSRSVSGRYSPGATLDITLNLSLQGGGTLTGLGVEETLPTGWTYDSLVSGNLPSIAPTTPVTFVEFVWDPPPSTVQFTYRVRVPLGDTGQKQISGRALYRLQGVSGELQTAAVVSNITAASSTVTYVASPPAGGTVTGPATILTDRTATVTVTPQTGYSLQSLTASNGSITASAPYLLSNVTLNTTVTATFWDVTPPTITSCAPGRTLATGAGCTTLVPNLTGDVAATDGVTPSGSLTITQDPAAGSEISGAGAHTVTITVKDAANNAATCTTTLTLSGFSESGTIPTVVPWATNGTVRAMAASATTLYLGGSFTWAGAVGGSGSGWTNLAAVNLASGAVQNWKPVPTGAVTSLALSADGLTLYAGGSGFVDAVVVSTTAVTQIATTTGTVAGLAVSGTQLYLGGDFTAIPTNGHLGVFNLATSAFTGWMTGVTAPVLSVAVSGGMLYAGEASGIQAVNLDAGSVAAFSASNGPVSSLAASCGTLYAGGSFTSIGGLSRAGLAALNWVGVAKTGWAPAPNGAVGVLALMNSALYAAGAFTTVDALYYPGLVRFAAASSPTVTVNQASGQTDPALAPTGTVPVHFAVSFSEAVTGFAADDITWSGTATGITYAIAGSGASYTINVTASSTGTLVPSIAPGRCIGAAGNYNAASTSTDNSVTVAVPSITVTAPPTGAYWGTGSTHAITWTAPLVTGNVEIRLYIYPAGTYVTLVTGIAASQGGWTWTVPAGQAAGTQYRIRVVGTSYAGFGPASPNYFSIGRPVLTLNGSATVNLECGSAYTDAGATASDGYVPALTVTVGGTVNPSTPGTYTLTYNTGDGQGDNALPVSRVVTVADTIAPVITLVGSASLTLECGSGYTDAGVTATDACAGNLTAGVAVVNPVNASVPGVYTVTYNVNDGHGHAAAQATRVVTVSDTANPVIALNGSATVSIECGAVYTEAGATAADACAGNRPVTIGGATVNPAVPGSYTVTYSAGDTSGHSATKSRTVNVVDTVRPVITLLGTTPVDLERGRAYTDAGATAADLCAGSLTGHITVTNPLNAGVVGSYTIRYNVGDGYNAANEVTRVVNVFFIDHSPVITTCPAGRSLATDALCGAVVPNLVPEVVATDDVTPAGSLLITQTPAAGTVVTGGGVHMVTISVTDEVNNTTTCPVALTLTEFDYANSLATLVPWAVNTGNSGIYAMASTPTALFIGGNFTGAGPSGSVPSTGWKNLAKIDTATGVVDTAWQPVVEAGTYPVRALVLSADGSTLYVSNYTWIDAVNISTKVVTRLVTLGNYTYGMAVSNGYLYFGGANYGSGHYLGSLRLSDSTVGWITGVTATVTAATIAGDTLYVGIPTGVQAVNIGASYGAVSTVCSSNGAVKGLGASCGAVYAGGAFTTIGGLARTGFAVLNNAGAVQTGWVPVFAAGGAVNTLCVSDTALYGAGGFTTVNGYAFAGVVRFASTTAPTVTINQAAGQIDPAPLPGPATPVLFTAVFSEPVSGLTPAKLTWGGTATGVSATVSPGSGPASTYTISVTSATAGTLVPGIGAAKCWGAAGNYNAASTSTDNSVTVSAGSGTLTVTQPASGVYWAAGTTHAVGWTSSLVPGTVAVDLYDYNGTALTNPNYGTFVELASGVAVTQGSWNWAIPAGQSYGTGWRIRIVGSNAGAYSTGSFEIGLNDTVAPTVTVNQAAGQIDPAPTPNASYPVQFAVQFSEPVTGFTIDDLSWAGSTATGITANVLANSSTSYTLRVTASGTGTLVPSVPAGAAVDGARNFNTASTGADNSVTVAGAAPSAITVTAPLASGAYWGRGATQTVTWDGALLAGTASIWLYDYNGNGIVGNPLYNPNYGTHVELTSSVAANAGSWQWAIPAGQTVGTGYKIRVLALQAQNAPSGYSGYCEIGADTPTVRVTTMNTGEPVCAPGAVIPVTWLSYRVTGNVSIYLYDYTPTTPTSTLLAGNLAVGLGAWNWTIPAGQTLGGMYKLRVYQSSSVTDFNDVYFAVGTGSPSARMIAPNGGETWTRGQTKTVSWTTNAVTSTLQVILYNYTTGAQEVLATVKPTAGGVGTYSWTIPAGHATGTKFKMRILGNVVADFSDAYFAIN